MLVRYSFVYCLVITCYHVLNSCLDIITLMSSDDATCSVTWVYVDKTAGGKCLSTSRYFGNKTQCKRGYINKITLKLKCLFSLSITWYLLRHCFPDFKTNISCMKSWIYSMQLFSKISVTWCWVQVKCSSISEGADRVRGRGRRGGGRGETRGGRREKRGREEGGGGREGGRREKRGRREKEERREKRGREEGEGRKKGREESFARAQRAAPEGRRETMGREGGGKGAGGGRGLPPCPPPHIFYM